jgi:hypothetical protein
VGGQTNVDIVKRWSNEVQEAVQSKAPLVQFHALALLHQVLQWPPCVISHMFANFILGFLVANIFVIFVSDDKVRFCWDCNQQLISMDLEPAESLFFK